MPTPTAPHSHPFKHHLSTTIFWREDHKAIVRLEGFIHEVIVNVVLSVTVPKYRWKVVTYPVIKHKSVNISIERYISRIQRRYIRFRDIGAWKQGNLNIWRFLKETLNSSTRQIPRLEAGYEITWSIWGWKTIHWLYRHSSLYHIS